MAHSQDRLENMDSKKIEIGQSAIKSTKPSAVPNNDSLFGESVRRSPRAPARVKTNFNDVFSKESGTKKRPTDTNQIIENEVSPASADFPGPVDTADGRKVDAHCWLCHKARLDNEPEPLSCVRCVRVFHSDCLHGTQRFSDEGLCPECKITSLDGTKLHDSLTPDRLAKLLTYALNTMMKNVPQLKFNYSEKQSHDLVCPVDLPKLLKDIEQQHYKSTAEFLSDVKWILHNLMILPKVNRALITGARKFVTECRSEMLDIEACPDCYAHMHSLKENWFSKLCNVNHTLVWVKVRGYPYWPAKVLKVIDGVADVRFFGTHEKYFVKVPGDNCFQLSKESPNHKVPGHSLFKVGLEELEMYTRNAHKGHGPIKYFPLETKYNPVAENISTKQVNRKREHPNNGPQSKPKRQKTSVVSAKDSSAELDKTPKVICSPQKLNSGAETMSVTPSVNGVTNQPEQCNDSKKGTDVSSPKETAVVDKSNKSATIAKSGATDQTASRNIPKHSEHKNSTSHNNQTQCNKCSIVSSKGLSTVSSAKQGDKSSTSCVERTRPEKQSAEPNLESDVPAHSANSNNELAFGSNSVLKDNSCDETRELLPENSETESLDASVLEEISDSGDTPFVPEQFGADGLSGTVEESVPLNTNEALNPANMLEFYEEDTENQNDFSYESGATPAYGYSNHIVESTHIRRPQPFSVEVSSNVEPMISQQQPCSNCVFVPGPAHSQDRYICTVPLPEEVNVDKYYEKVKTTIRATVEEIWHDYVNSRNIQNLIFRAQQETEDMKLRYKKEAEEVAKNTNMIIASLERKHAEALEALRRKYKREKEDAINELKKKLLCSNCGKDAMFICCGDDSCCDHPCQKAHWLVEELASSSSSAHHVNSSFQPLSPDSSVCHTRKTWNKEQSRTLIGVVSNKGQAQPPSQHAASSHHFQRPSAVRLPPLTPRPPEAQGGLVLNRASSVPPDSSSL